LEQQTERRMTRHRQVILNEIRKSTGHPTASEVYEMVRKSLPRISLGTVYRNLQILSESGILRTLETGGSKRRFDWNLSGHNHILCVRCGRVDDVGYDLKPDVEETIGSICGYKVTGYLLAFKGLCPKCRNMR